MLIDHSPEFLADVRRAAYGITTDPTTLMFQIGLYWLALVLAVLIFRELQVLQLVAQGLPNKGIARQLGISENTAKFHVASLCGKLAASSRTEAVTIAARGGLILL